MGMGMEAICVGMDGDGDRVKRGWLGMDSKFAGTDGDGDKLSSPCSSLAFTRQGDQCRAVEVYRKILTPCSAFLCFTFLQLFKSKQAENNVA